MGEKEEGGKNVTAILQIAMHCSCEGCSERVLKCVHGLHDLILSMKIEANGTTYKVTVIGKFDPVKLRQKIEKKLKKKVTLISPKLGKEENEIDQKHICKEPSVTTAVFKLPLNCDSCNEQIYKIITLTGGCRNMKMDWEKNLVTVTGTIDVKSLAESLRYHLRKDVEILTVKDSRSGVYLPEFEYLYRISTTCRSVTTGDLYHVAEVFSDENPNACTIL
ncbi:PREDICTED: heavy metal-associated isoprenylated plant protein 3-like [Nicotiana attenuata]|uniref:Heavy metal-associated isoprenylated plant protein 3 n=1 Tax=Nicotiana attenuata TaxID=49451 RepID=A0A314KNU1_NICAT|nr:PREDICTED: heavy metal-associated isoprenylated plant protein 3-like [Nicotiana attenuata]OIT31016.1 heavy metal-associated isoprenylated plant protein 3 [Nicotiana attenuata]